MIYIDNLSKSFNDNYLFYNANIMLKKGMRIGLVGANGTGKTTLLRILVGEENYDSGNVQTDKKISIGYLPQDIISGTKYSVLEETLKSFPKLKRIEVELGRLNEKIKQNPRNESVIKTVGELQHEYEAMGGWSIENKAKKILAGLGFNEGQFKKKVSTFSGGWRMRIALASILLKKPDIIFLDEPTNHLDLDATIWLENFLNDWKGTLVLISHDRIFLDKSVNHILEIEFKKVFLFKGNYSNYISEKNIRIEQQMSAFQNQKKQIKQTERFIQRFRYKSKKASQVQSRVKALAKIKKIESPLEDNKILNLIIPSKKRSPLKIIWCYDLGKSYDSNIVFKSLNFTVERNKKIGLIGYNGAGKSTLLKLLANVIDPSSGQIKMGEDVKIAYYAQHQLELLDKGESVFESIASLSYGKSDTEIRTYLGSFLFSGEDIEKNIEVLSGGEKARVALARMLMEPVDLLLLDEPTNHLDMRSLEVLEMALKRYKGSIVCISHDRHFLNKVTNTIWKVQSGKIQVYDGNYDYFIWKEKKISDKNLRPEKLVKNNKETDFNYKMRKKYKNRLNWIEKRFSYLDNEINIEKKLLDDPINSKDYKELQKKIEKIQILEEEYFKLIDEQEKIQLAIG
tara:strand:- start:6464 stop:8341 length:1878 start_codon:yes stop_codon:yes gene_type:complete